MSEQIERVPIKALKYALWKKHRRHPEFEAAEKIKDKRIGELKAGGMEAEEAARQAWGELDAALTGAGLPAEPLQQAEPLKEKSATMAETDYPTAARWVLDNLAVAVEFGDAPSPGAWAMLVWARESRADFFKTVLPKALEIEAKRLQAAAGPGEVENDDTADLSSLLG